MASVSNSPHLPPIVVPWIIRAQAWKILIRISRRHIGAEVWGRGKPEKLLFRRCKTFFKWNTRKRTDTHSIEGFLAVYHVAIDHVKVKYGSNGKIHTGVKTNLLQIALHDLDCCSLLIILLLKPAGCLTLNRKALPQQALHVLKGKDTREMHRFAR